MAGLNIPKRSELPHGTFLGDVNKARLDAQGKLSDYAERASGVAGDMLFGEDTGEGMLKDLGRTPAFRKLVEFAERDPRRSEDFTINFDRLEDYLSQPADKYDVEIKRNVVPYITSF